MDMPRHFIEPRHAALALLTHGNQINRKAAGFLGVVAVDPSPLTAKQRDWMDGLLSKNDLPPLLN